MDSSSFELTLKPCNIFVPKIWSNFLVHLSNIHDLSRKLCFVKNFKLQLQKEASRFVASGPQSFTMSMEFLKNAIISLREEEETIMKNISITCSRDAEERTLRRRRFASGFHHETNGISALMEGCRDEGNSSGNSFSLYHQHQQKVTGILDKRKQASEEPSQAPTFPSFGAMPSSPISLPPALCKLSSSDGQPDRVSSPFGSSDSMFTRVVPQVISDKGKRVLESLQEPLSETIFKRPLPHMSLDKGKRVVENPSPFGWSDTMFTEAVPQGVSDKGKRVLENLQQPSSETIFSNPLPCMNLDKGKQVVENPSIYLKLNEQGHLTIAGLWLEPASTPPVTGRATAVLDKGKQASALVFHQAQPVSRSRFPPSLLDQINRNSGL